jgi:polysaccharide biosynthesis protein PslJ
VTTSLQATRPQPTRPQPNRLPSTRTPSTRHASHGSPPPRRRLSDRALPPWPVAGVFVLYPLWWTLGVTPFVFAGAGAVCLTLMTLRGRVLLPPTWIWWASFLVWSLLSVVMIDSGGRLVGFVQRWSEMCGAGLVVLYAYNAPELATRRRLVGAMTVMIAWLTVGGWLGMLAPYGRIRTPALAILPRSIATNSYVVELLSPRFAEVQDPWGASEAFIRPAAPFPYTNGWGNTFVLVTLVMAALAVHAGRRTRWLLGLGWLAALPPAMATLNRGILVGLGCAGVYIAVRRAREVRAGDWARLAAAVGAVTVAVLASGAADRLTERTSTSTSTQDRAALYAETFTRTLASPLLGWGAPRPSRTLPVSAGTQGEVWFLMFSYGFVGLGLFVGALVALVFVTWRVRDLESTVLHAVPVALGVMMIFYGIDGLQLTMAFCCALLLLPRPTAPTRPIAAENP